MHLEVQILEDLEVLCPWTTKAVHFHRSNSIEQDSLAEAENITTKGPALFHGKGRATNSGSRSLGHWTELDKSRWGKGSNDEGRRKAGLPVRRILPEVSHVLKKRDKGCEKGADGDDIRRGARNLKESKREPLWPRVEETFGLTIA